MSPEKDLEQKSYEEHLRELEWFSQEKRRLSEDFVVLYDKRKQPGIKGSSDWLH